MKTSASSQQKDKHANHKSDYKLPVNCRCIRSSLAIVYNAYIVVGLHATEVHVTF